MYSRPSQYRPNNGAIGRDDCNTVDWNYLRQEVHSVLVEGHVVFDSDIEVVSPYLYCHPTTSNSALHVSWLVNFVLKGSYIRFKLHTSHCPTVSNFRLYRMYYIIYRVITLLESE